MHHGMQGEIEMAETTLCNPLHLRTANKCKKKSIYVKLLVLLLRSRTPPPLGSRALELVARKVCHVLTLRCSNWQRSGLCGSCCNPFYLPGNLLVVAYKRCGMAASSQRPW